MYYEGRWYRYMVNSTGFHKVRQRIFIFLRKIFCWLLSTSSSALSRNDSSPNIFYHRSPFYLNCYGLALFCIFKFATITSLLRLGPFMCSFIHWPKFFQINSKINATHLKLNLHSLNFYDTASQAFYGTPCLFQVHPVICLSGSFHLQCTHIKSSIKFLAAVRKTSQGQINEQFLTRKLTFRESSWSKTIYVMHINSRE